MSGLDVESSRFMHFFEKLKALMPGFLICLTIAFASSFVADHYGGPTLLFALLFGMSLHFLSDDQRCILGIDFTSRTILRMGVALLGVRITLDEVVGLGVGPILVVVLSVCLTISMGVIFSRLLGLNRNMGMLTGGAVAICGASAALALSTVMPRHKQHEQHTILTVVGVTTLSTVAMITYPLLVSLWGLTDVEAGILLGGTIHDVAQVVGAGYMISEDAGDVATFVKLLRVAMLVPAVMVFTFIFRKQRSDSAGGKVPALPMFLVVFVLIVIVNSVGVIPQFATELATDLSRWCLVAAIAGLGVKTSFKKLAVVGWKPVILMVLETLFLLAFVYACLYFGWVGG